MSPDRACDRCLGRAWLLGRLDGHLECVRNRIGSVLALGDEDLIAAVAGERRAEVAGELERFDAQTSRERSAQAGLAQICRCDRGYPRRLMDLPNPPAVLHVAGGVERFLGLVADEPIAIVGARGASRYGLEIARTLGHGLGSAQVTVLSGMALGIDSAAHAGALAAGAPTVAILPGGADRPYPAAKRALQRQIQTTGAAVSELPPGSAPRRWAFPARNRILAALSVMTVVVEAGERSGALITAKIAAELGRAIGAVPGRVTSPLATGPNGLIAAGARVLCTPQDVLDEVYGAGRRLPTPAASREELSPDLRRVLAAIGDGEDTNAALVRAGFACEHGLAALATLELAGYVRRGPGGRYGVVP